MLEFICRSYLKHKDNMSGRTNIIGYGSNTDIDNLEEDIVVVTDLTLLSKTQLTLYIDYSLGTNTSIKIRYYVRNVVGGDWYQIPVKNEITSVLTDLPTTITSASPASRVVEDIPLSACFAFKATGQGAGGANSSVTITVFSRNN